MTLSHSQILQYLSLHSVSSPRQCARLPCDAPFPVEACPANWQSVCKQLGRLREWSRKVKLDHEGAAVVGETLPTPQKQVQGRLLASHPCKYHKACLRGPCIHMSVVAPLVRDMNWLGQ